MNLTIKFREGFRPFAPSVLRERVADYFELDVDSPYMLPVARELWIYFRVRKRLWLAPILVLMALLGALMVVAQGSPLAPFIYTIF